MVVEIKYLFMKVTAKLHLKHSLVNVKLCEYETFRPRIGKTEEHSFRDSANEMFCDKAIYQIKPVRWL